MENDTSSKATTLQIDRPVYQLYELNKVTQYNYQPTKFKDKCKEQVHQFNALACLFQFMPVLYWLPRYRWRKNIIGDIISGATVAIMHIPQGMAYGLIGNLPPITGIYMAFFPVLVYFVFGTSRHVSIGTFAITCLMTGKVVAQYSDEDSAHQIFNSTLEHFNDSHTRPYSSIEVATTVTFTVAIIQILMYLFRLGILANILSDTLVNAFTCACAFHVVFAQMKDLLGLPLQKQTGYFKIIRVAYYAALSLPQANFVAIGISFGFIIFMTLNNVLLKPWLAKKTKLLFPIELIAVCVGSLMSYLANMHELYGVSIVGHVPTGLPSASLPAFSLIPSVIPDALVITMVSYTVTMSMALTFAKKDHYEIDANQELFALGASNICGSMFSCMPVTASLSRSLIQHAVGGVTQLASIVSCTFLFFILLWIGPLFETLPRCVLAAVIVVALKQMLMKITQLKKYWELSKWDGLVWITTFFTTIIVEIHIGLLAGVSMALLALFVQGQMPYTCLLGVVPNTDLYLDLNRYQEIEEVHKIKIFHYCGTLNFASKELFKNMLCEKIGFNPSHVLRKLTEVKEASTSSFSSEGEGFLLSCVILDFGALTYIDPSGVQMLRGTIDEFKQLNIEVFIASCSGPVYETLKRCDIYENKEGRFIIFATVHDSVVYAQTYVINKNKNS